MQADLDALKDLVEKTNIDNMTDADVEAIKAAKETLMQSAQTVFSKMYEQQAAANGGAQAGPDMGAADGGYTSADDDVVDGDYREV